jgi:hypothetical protein
MLARRLSRYGLALSGGALATALAQGAALAQVPARAAAASSQATLLAEGVVRAMFLVKVKVVFGGVLLAALAAGGIAYRAGGAQAAPPEKRSESKPPSEVEALRKEVELLRLNLRVVLEKLRAQEAELLAAKAARKNAAVEFQRWERTPDGFFRLYRRTRVAGSPDRVVESVLKLPEPAPDPLKEVEAALKALRAARDPAAKHRAADALQKATKRVQEQLKLRPAGDAAK